MLEKYIYAKSAATRLRYWNLGVGHSCAVDGIWFYNPERNWEVRKWNGNAQIADINCLRILHQRNVQAASINANS
jgi:hypothetical protein